MVGAYVDHVVGEYVGRAIDPSSLSLTASVPLVMARLLCTLVGLPGPPGRKTTEANTTPLIMRKAKVSGREFFLTHEVVVAVAEPDGVVEEGLFKPSSAWMAPLSIESVGSLSTERLCWR